MTHNVNVRIWLRAFPWPPSVSMEGFVAGEYFVLFLRLQVIVKQKHRPLQRLGASRSPTGDLVPLLAAPSPPSPFLFLAMIFRENKII